MSEYISVRRSEWEGFRRDLERFIQRHKESLEKITHLTRENVDLKEKLATATEKLAQTEQKVAAELQQTTTTLQKMRTNISRLLEQDEKENVKS
ncbi:hypothetical protein [[Eubacterium] cellulosolvens]